LGREVDTPRTTPGGAAVPDGTAVNIYRKTDLVTPVASTTISAGKYDHEYDGSYGPTETRVTHGGETRIRDSWSIGQAGPLPMGDMVFLLAGLGSGVFTGIRNELLVTAGAPGRRVYVRSGVGAAAGITYNQFTDNKQSPEFSANVSGQPRIDLIGFKVWTAGHAEEGRAELAILEGTAAASPVAPTPTQTLEDGTWFETLAEVLLASGYSSITAGNITDRRLGAPRGQVPVGAISEYAGVTAPLGWRVCDGSALSRTGFAALFAVLGTVYGAGDGSTTFNLPNIKGRVVVGFNSGDGNFDAMGETGGVGSHVLTAAESGLPGHTHGHTLGTGIESVAHAHTSLPINNQNASRATGAFDTHNHAPGSGFTGTENTLHTHAITGGISAIASASAGAAHTNLQPYITLQKIIKT
jgi:microcystin-dependent protein